MTLRERVAETVRQRRFDELDELLAGDRRALRFVVALTYQSDAEIVDAAARAIARAASKHGRQVGEIVRRMVWAMNEESGTHAVNAPAVLRAIAETTPRLLLPSVPDLMRLSADPNLHDALVEVTRTVARAFPREAAAAVEQSLRSCGTNGGTRGPTRFECA